jgi:hypothetical protein
MKTRNGKFGDRDDLVRMQGRGSTLDESLAGAFLRCWYLVDQGAQELGAANGIALLTRGTEFRFEVLGKGDNGIAFCPSQRPVFRRQVQQCDACTHIFPHFLPHISNLAVVGKGAD